MCILRFVLAVLAACVPAAAQINAAPQVDVDWVTTWGASPVAPLPNEKTNPGFRNQTVRMIVHSSVGGSEVRVRLSNVFGTGPLSIGEARIALRSAGANIVPGTDRALAFSGMRSVTVAPGASVTSDSVALDVPAFSDLAVSIFFPQATGPATWHPLALSTNYIRSGNVAAMGNWGATVAEQLPGAEPASWFYLTDVEVRIPKKNSAIIAFGDSITDGVGSTLNANHRWPNFLAERLAGAGRAVAVVDEGISGNGILSVIMGPSGLSRFDRDVLEQSGAKYVIVLLGINDIGQSARHPVTAAAITAAYHELIARAHKRGLKIYGGTLTPIGGSFYDSPAHEAMRQAVNDFIRKSGTYDGVIDFDAAVRDPDHPLRFKPEYNSGDSLHPSDAGYQAMAKAIDLQLFRGQDKDEDESSFIDPNGEPPAAAAGALEPYYGSLDQAAFVQMFALLAWPQIAFRTSPDFSPRRHGSCEKTQRRRCGKTP